MYRYNGHRGLWPHLWGNQSPVSIPLFSKSLWNKGSCLLSGSLRGNWTQWEDLTSSKTTMQCFQNLILCPVTIKYSICRSKLLGFLGGSDGKESACSAGDLGWIPGLGRFAGGGHGNPLQYSCLESPHGQRSLSGYSPWGSQRVGHNWATKHSTHRDVKKKN